jgi:hypothetical protein
VSAVVSTGSRGIECAHAGHGGAGAESPKPSRACLPGRASHDGRCAIEVEGEAEIGQPEAETELAAEKGITCQEVPAA